MTAGQAGTPRSLGEIEAMLRKAAAGSGLDAGRAEDVARASVWLVAHAHAQEGFNAALEALERPGDVSAAQEGPAIIDLVLTGETVEVQRVDVPPLLVGLAGIAAAAHGWRFAFESGSGTCSVAADGPAGEPPVPPFTVRGEAAGTAAKRLHGSFAVDREAWERADTLARRTYVPASETSRLAGAGAGDTDND